MRTRSVAMVTLALVVAAASAMSFAALLIDGADVDSAKRPESSPKRASPREVAAATCTTPCDDGDPCTINDTCTSWGSCEGAPKPCEDGNSCTSNGCDSTSGACVHQPVSKGESCPGPHDLCTVRRCDGKGGCVLVPDAWRCDDHNPCTLDVCKTSSPDRYDCTNSPQKAGQACDDGDPCTAAGTCQYGACVNQVDKCKTLYSYDFPCGDKTWKNVIPYASGGTDDLKWSIGASPKWPVAHSGNCMLYMLDGFATWIPETAGTPGGYARTATVMSPYINIPSHGTAVLRYWRMLGSSRMVFAVHVDHDNQPYLPNGSTQWWGWFPKLVWTHETLSLAKWAGKSIRIFFWSKVSNKKNPLDEGTFIDDVEVRWMP